MMKSSRLEKDKKTEGNIIKDVADLFRLKKEIDDTTVKNIRNTPFRLRREIDDTTVVDIRSLFEKSKWRN